MREEKKIISCEISLFNDKLQSAIAFCLFASLSLWLSIFFHTSLFCLHSLELIKSAIVVVMVCFLFLLFSFFFSLTHSIQFCLPSSSVRIRVNSKALFLNHLRDFFFFWLCKVKFFPPLFGIVGSGLLLTTQRRSMREKENFRGFTLLISIRNISRFTYV
jgi:hypothetical protein